MRLVRLLSTTGWVISIVHSPIGTWNGSSFALGSALSILQLLRSRFRARDIAPSLPAIGGPLVDQHEHALADDLRLLQPQVASLGLLLEGLLARPEDHREDHQV